VEAQILEVQELELSGRVSRQLMFPPAHFLSAHAKQAPAGRLFVFRAIALRQRSPRERAGAAPTPSAVVTMMVVMAVMMMPVMAMVPVMAMMPMVAPMMMVMMPSPMDLGGLHLGTLLNRRGGAGIGQRQRLGALGWHSEHQQTADRSQSQKFHYVHAYSPLG
jgi:hypothetical protein